jgi:hypothetical protein
MPKNLLVLLLVSMEAQHQLGQNRPKLCCPHEIKKHTVSGQQKKEHDTKELPAAPNNLVSMVRHMLPIGHDLKFLITFVTHTT